MPTVSSCLSFCDSMPFNLSFYSCFGVPSQGTTVSPLIYLPPPGLHMIANRIILQLFHQTHPLSSWRRILETHFCNMHDDKAISLVHLSAYGNPLHAGFIAPPIRFTYAPFYDSPTWTLGTGIWVCEEVDKV